MSTRERDAPRAKSVFEELSRMYATRPMSEVVRYMDSVRFPVKTDTTRGGYRPGDYVGGIPFDDGNALYKNSDVYADGGFGRVSEGLRGLELLSATCSGVPSNDLFLFDNKIFYSNAYDFKRMDDDSLITAVIANLGMSRVVMYAEMVSPSSVTPFRELCLRIAKSVRNGTFQREPVWNRVLRHGKQLASVASRYNGSK